MQTHKSSFFRSVFRSPTNSLVSTPDSEEHSSLPQNIAFAFAALLSDLTCLLERHEGALYQMKLTFQFIARIMKSKAYYTLLQSKRYKKIKSVDDFFLLLTKFWKPVDCSLLITLVKATHCEPAIKRLQAFLSSRDVEEDMTQLMLQSQVPYVSSGASIPASTVTTSPLTNDVLTQLKKEETNSPSSHRSADQLEPPVCICEKNEQESILITTQPKSHQPDILSIQAKVAQNSLILAEYERKDNILCGALKIPIYFSVDQLKPPASNSEKEEQDSIVLTTQPHSHHPDFLSVQVKVAQNSLTLSGCERKAKILCGALKIPRSVLQLVTLDSGSVIIQMVTSKGSLPSLKSKKILDADLLLLLNESVMTIQIGTEYFIHTGSTDYWIKVWGCGGYGI